MNYVESLIIQFPRTVSISRVGPFVTLYWHAGVYSIDEIADFAGIDRDMILESNNEHGHRYALDIPRDIAESTQKK